MSVIASIICPECGKLYNDSTRRTCIGKCHHSICLFCENNLKSSKCPICDEAGAFQETVINHQTDNFLVEFQKSLSEADIEKITEDLQSVGQGPCSKCNAPTKKLRICTKCTPYIAPDGRGGWRPSYWLSGANSSLKTKSLAICADCAIDYHEEHKVINLMSVESIFDDFEIDCCISLRILIERNWQRDVEAGRTTSLEVKPKSLALQWKLQDRIEEIRSRSFENTQLLINTVEFLPWRPELEASFAEVQKYQQLSALLMKRNKLGQMKYFPIAANFMITSGGKENQKRGREILKNCKLLPTIEISKEDCDRYDKEVTKNLIILSVEMAKRHPDRRTDKEFLRFQVIKEEMIKVKEALKAAELGIDESFHDLHEYLNEDQEKHQPNLLFYREYVNKQLKVDEAYVKKLKARMDEQIVGLMLEKCGESSVFAGVYGPEIEKVIARYEQMELSFLCRI